MRNEVKEKIDMMYGKNRYNMKIFLNNVRVTECV